MKNKEALKNLQTIPGIGKSIAQNLFVVGCWTPDGEQFLSTDVGRPDLVLTQSKVIKRL